jgi:DnaJ-class molecular chaperone
VLAAQRLKQQQQQQQAELEQRKNRLNSAFGSAFANAAKARQEQAKQAAAAAAVAAPAPGSATAADADEAEVKRVLSSKNDYDVLQLKPGCDAAALKKRFKEMVVRLHPDKCKAADATLAFQRMHKAYQELQALIR